LITDAFAVLPQDGLDLLQGSPFRGHSFSGLMGVQQG
jgi:hypothetical protein